MLITAEELYGHYPGGRYDDRPSIKFSFWGHGKSYVDFATPTILVGDRSLTSLLLMSLRIPGSGNLVTNSTWNDFSDLAQQKDLPHILKVVSWKKLYGKEYADMLSLLGYQDLQKLW